MTRPVRKASDPPVEGQILAAALKLFAHLGYERASIRAIAKKAKVTAGGVYYYFDSKRDILFRALEEGTRNLVEACEAAVEVAGEGPADRLRAFIHTHIAFQLQQIHTMAPLYTAWVSDAVSRRTVLTKSQQERLRTLEHRHLDNLRSILGDGVRSGDFDVDNVTATAFAILGMGEHVLRWFKPGGKIRTANDVASHHASLALRLVSGGRG